MSKHTPGPWNMAIHIASEYGETEFCSMAIYGAAGTYDEDLQIATIISDCIDGHEANASLIAAAPDLLEALEGFVSCWDAGASPIEFAGNARAAIAKARGEL